MNDSELLKVVLSMTAEDNPDWVCDELCEYDNKWCEEHCKPRWVQPECVKRLAEIYAEKGWYK